MAKCKCLKCKKEEETKRIRDEYVENMRKENQARFKKDFQKAKDELWGLYCLFTHEFECLEACAYRDVVRDIVHATELLNELLRFVLAKRHSKKHPPKWQVTGE